MNNVMETVSNVCNKVRIVSKQRLTFHKLLSALRKEFKLQGFDLRIKSSRDKHLDNNIFFVNAYYDPEDDKHHDTAIEVVVHHNFNKDDIWELSEVTGFLTQIFDAVVHEFKHQRQSRKRKYKVYWHHTDTSSDYAEYLQDPDELDAYAFSIAVELCRTLGKYRALKYMVKFSTLARLKFNGQYVSPNLSSYVDTLGDLSNPAIKKLAKKVYIRILKVDTDAIFL